MHGDGFLLDATVKSCCGVPVSQTVSIRWVKTTIPLPWLGCKTACIVLAFEFYFQTGTGTKRYGTRYGTVPNTFPETVTYPSLFFVLVIFLLGGTAVQLTYRT